MNFADFCAGSNHNCALSHDKQIKCIGQGTHGQLGYGSSQSIGDNQNEMGAKLPNVELGSNLTPIRIKCGGFHTCVRFLSNQMKCWGRNTFGQLALGDSTNRGDQPNEMGNALEFIKVTTNQVLSSAALGYHHTCVVLDEHDVKCVGDNGHGQLGYGDKLARGHNMDTIANSLPKVDMGSSPKVISVFTGPVSYHTCAKLYTNNIKCWGYNNYGQLGLGDNNDRGDDAEEMGDNLPVVDLGDRIAVQLSLGMMHTCAIVNTGDAVCWGYNMNGELGLGSMIEGVGDSSGEMGNAAMPMNLGSNSNSQVACGNQFTCVLLDNDSVKCVGLNDHGQLGQGDPDPRGQSELTTGTNLPSIKFAASSITNIQVGHAHACAVFANTEVKCWGWGAHGQLGFGHSNDIGDMSDSMGMNLPFVEFFVPPATNSPTFPPVIPTMAPHTKPGTVPPTVKHRNADSAGLIGGIAIGIILLTAGVLIFCRNRIRKTEMVDEGLDDLEANYDEMGATGATSASHRAKQDSYDEKDHERTAGMEMVDVGGDAAGDNAARADSMVAPEEKAPPTAAPDESLGDKIQLT